MPDELEIDNNTVWFKVYKSRSDYGSPDTPWDIRSAKGSELGKYGRKMYGGSFATKDEAITAGLDQGWILIDTWDDAIKQYAPYQKTLMERSDQRRAAIEGTFEVRFEVGKNDKGRAQYVSRYLSPTRAQALLESLSNYNEFGVVQDD